MKNVWKPCKRNWQCMENKDCASGGWVVKFDIKEAKGLFRANRNSDQNNAKMCSPYIGSLLTKGVGSLKERQIV